MPDGTIKYKQTNSVNPSGINGQSVYNGSDGSDRVIGGLDNDTFWGGAGSDVIDGGGGSDVTLGGEGNDIITDLDGTDIQKGGPGNDAMDGGPGNDIEAGGDGSDFVNGGSGDNETFGGAGNDFIIAGQGADSVLGGGGDDWIEGGTGQDLLHGDHGAPFLDDPGESRPGNDIFIGQPGDNDYNAEGGDDLMAQNAAIDRNAGAGGFDWAFHQYDTVGAHDDMNINNNLAGLTLPVVANRDRWQETEADSGSAFDDVIKGDNFIPYQQGSTIGGVGIAGGFTGCDALDQAGLDRIHGLAAIVSLTSGTDAQAQDATGVGHVAGLTCPLRGAFWGGGNILLGGAGSDTLEGRGGNDIIDGDRTLTVRISVRSGVDADGKPTATEIGSTDLMEHQYLRDANGDLTGPTLQAAVFDGKVDPGSLVATREITTPDPGTSTDTAVFTGPRSNYTITPTPTDATKVTVRQKGPNVAGQDVSDGTDTLYNVGKLRFSDVTIDNTTDSLAGPPAAGDPPATPAATSSTTPPATPPAAGDSAAAAPAAGAAAAPSVAGVPAAASRLVAGRLRVGMAPGSGGLIVVTDIPARARVAQIRVVRLGATGSRRTTIATVLRKTKSAKRQKFLLAEKGLRHLAPGRYLVEVKLGATAAKLGPATMTILRVHH
jgi:Ca2+-binding RTX toxin-like protein